MGITSPIGNELDIFWESLVNGRSSMARPIRVDASLYDEEIKTSEMAPSSDDHESNLSKSHKYTLRATRKCLEDAGLSKNILIKEEVGFVIGSTSCNYDLIEKVVDSLQLTGVENEKIEIGKEALRYFKNMRPVELSAAIASEFNFKGPNMVISNACSAGNSALAIAYQYIKTGRHKLIISGGAEPFFRVILNTFYSVNSIAKKGCRPFDKNREGLVLSEGAAILALEDLEHALRRNAPIYGEISGYGFSCDAYHGTAPDPEGKGAMLSMEFALKSSRLNPRDISYISAHGTGTKANDIQEAKAIAKVFGDEIKKIPITSNKSILGHSIGAASAIETVAALLSIKNQVIPPTINTLEIDPSMSPDLDIVVGKSRTRKIDHVLNNSFGFGGNNCTLILSKYTLQQTP
jgi:3-oxoacyl-[acyl-carrier-protein] synthase II